MLKKFIFILVVYTLFSPTLFSETPFTGGPGSSAGGRETGGSGSQPGVRRNNGAGDQIKKPAEPAASDNVNEILMYEDKLGLTSQQAVSMKMISADAMLEASEKSNTVVERRREFTNSLNQLNPDFTNIRAELSKLVEAQANAEAVPVNAYEKAYALLTDKQKITLSFFRAIRRQELEKKAEEAAQAQDNKQTTPVSISPAINGPATIIH